MSDLHNLERVLKDESSTLSDLDWLDVDKEDYRNFEEDLPKQNLDSIPDLEKQWKGRSESDAKFNLSPVNKEPEKKNTPFWSENSTKTGLTPKEKSEIVERFLKRKMMEGKSARDSLEILKNEFSPNTLKEARPQIKKAIKEDGLLGTVYVESELFTDCDQGEGQDFVRKHAKNAKYVEGKDKCHDCIYNKNGVCSQFQKEIVFDVDYGGDLWDFYKKKFEEQGKDLSHIDPDNPPKIKIKNASKAPSRDESDKRLDGKPVQEFPQDRISTEEAREEVQKIDTKQKVVGNVYKERKREKVAKTMMSRGSSGQPLDDPILDQIESDPALSDLSKQANLLGPLYIDLSYFETKKEAKSFIQENSIPVEDRVVVGSPKDSSEEGNPSPLRTKKALNSILRRYAITNFGSDYEDKKGLLRKIGKRLLNSDKERLRKFAKGVFSEPLPQEKRIYDATGQIVQESSKLTKEEALGELKKVERKSSKVEEDTSTSSLKSKMAQKMMKTDFHDENIEQLILSSNKESLRSLQKHLHLLGNLYVDSSYFDTKEAFQEFVEENDLEDLPDLEGGNVEEFLQQDSIKSKLANWMSQIEEMRISSVEDLNPDNIHDLAQKLYSMELPKVSSYVDHDSTGSPSGREMMNDYEMGSGDRSINQVEVRENQTEKVEDISFGGMQLDF